MPAKTKKPAGKKAPAKKSTTSSQPRTVMNKKPVILRNAKTVLNDDNEEFQEKLLCDGIIFNLGDACADSCSFCYVVTSMRYIAPPLIKAYNKETGESRKFEDVVIRRKDAVGLLRGQLLKSDGTRRYSDDLDRRVAYSSTTVDVAANMDLLRETAGSLQPDSGQHRLADPAPVEKQRPSQTDCGQNDSRTPPSAVDIRVFDRHA